MGRKKNPFLTWKSEYKGKGKYWTILRRFGPILYGRIYDYRYSCRLRRLKENGFVSAYPEKGDVKPYRILLSADEIKEWNKEEDADFLVLFEREDGKKFVNFTEEEFLAFKRTKIIEHNINDGN